MSSTEDKVPPPLMVPAANISRSPNWRVIYCNVLGLGWGENEARLNIGFDQDLAKPTSNVLEEVLIVMPHRAAKILAFTLNSIISNYEAANGPIPVPDDRLKEIEKSIKTQQASHKPPAD